MGSFLRELEAEGACFLEDLPPGVSPPRRALLYDGPQLREVALASWADPARHPLLHLAYLARLRRQVGADLESWTVEDPTLDLEGTRPDALWEGPGGVWAVEVDLGHYTPDRVLRKALAFRRGFAGQLWGVRPSSHVLALVRGWDTPFRIVLLEG